MHKEQTPRDLINGWNAQAIAAMALSFFWAALGLCWGGRASLVATQAWLPHGV